MAPKAEKKPAAEKPEEEKAENKKVGKSPAVAGNKPKAEKRIPTSKDGGDKSSKKKKKGKSVETYKIYIFKVLKQVHPARFIIRQFPLLARFHHF